MVLYNIRHTVRAFLFVLLLNSIYFSYLFWFMPVTIFMCIAWLHGQCFGIMFV